MLTNAKIVNTKPSDKPIKLTDSEGLYLDVRPSGARIWRYRYRLSGKEQLFTVGQYPDLSLKDARAERDEAAKLVRRGIHPLADRERIEAEKRLQAANTFETVAREWIAQNKSNWSTYYAGQVERFLQATVFPDIGDRPIRDVNAAQLLLIIKRVEKHGTGLVRPHGKSTGREKGAPTVALLIRQWCSSIFRYAVATLRADMDPTGALRGALVRKKVEHHKPLTRADLPDFLAAIDSLGGYESTKIALKLMALLFTRTIELRGAQWAEFDLDTATWVIPSGRMKMRRPHVVPLSRQAVDLLRELQRLTGGRQWLFPNYRRPTQCMSATTINRALERMGFAGRGTMGFSGHGFRSTASTLLNEMNYRADLIERQLAHADRDKVRATYNHAEFLPERRQMMQAWADFLDELRAKCNVTPIRRVA